MRPPDQRLKASPLYVALVTCKTLPDWEVDDQPLFRELQARGIRLAHPCWDDPQVQWGAFDLVIPRTTWDYQGRFSEFSAWLRQVDRQSILLNPLSIIEWNLNKQYLRDLNVETPPTIWLDQWEGVHHGEPPQIKKLCETQGWTSGFLKPTIGANSWGTFRFNLHSPEELKQAQSHLEAWLTKGDMILQPYYESVETEGEFSLIFFDHSFSHAVQKIPVPGDYKVQDDYGATDVPWRAPQEWIEAGERALEGLRKTTLYARCDFLKGDRGQPQLIELELIEPSLFFRHDAQAAERLSDAIMRRARSA